MLRGFSYKTILQPLSAPNAKKMERAQKRGSGDLERVLSFACSSKDSDPPWLGIFTLGQLFGKFMKKGTLIEQYPYRQTCVRSVVVPFYSSIELFGKI